MMGEPILFQGVREGGLDLVDRPADRPRQRQQVRYRDERPDQGVERRQLALVERPDAEDPPGLAGRGGVATPFEEGREHPAAESTASRVHRGGFYSIPPLALNR